ncbi:MAG: DUF1841 family protein [Lautropia sp.]
MFDPSVGDVRAFFCGAWEKARAGSPLTPLEVIAVEWIDVHPEYHADLASVDEAKAREYPPASGRTNPFLHLSLHLAIAEQIAIDQPRGIRAASEALQRRTGSAHDAAHALLDCLAQAIWQAQRDRRPIDETAYRRAILQRAGIDG